jgi:hypothetical protein
MVGLIWVVLFAEFGGRSRSFLVRRLEDHSSRQQHNIKLVEVYTLDIAALFFVITAVAAVAVPGEPQFSSL